MRILTAGESHGEYISAVVEGFPKGVKVEESIINAQLKRRAFGPGRGKRMQIESDKVIITSGLRNKVTLGSPITMLVKNRDRHIFSQKGDRLGVVSVPRPAHADLAGALKYGDGDIRNILERASARETVARVCVGALCRQFLGNFGVQIASFTVSLGGVEFLRHPKDIDEIIAKTKSSKTNCLEPDKEKEALAAIESAKAARDSLGGVIEVWAAGVCPGLGTVMHYDRRLDARLAAAIMSIPAVKGVEVGLGFAYARLPGSQAHDAIYYSARRGFHHRTNNSGGIEGGISNGEAIVLRLAMKPIATLTRPLDSVDLRRRTASKAAVIRSDTCAVASCAVIAEGMAATVLTQAFLDKFGCDALKEIKSNYKNYIKTL